MTGKDFSEAINEAIPVEDNLQKSEVIREALIIERQWDRVLAAASRNLLEYENRAEWKSALLALEAYMADVLDKDKHYNNSIGSIKDNKKGSVQDEIDKGLMLMKALKRALSNSNLVAPLVYEDNDNYYFNQRQQEPNH